MLSVRRIDNRVDAWPKLTRFKACVTDGRESLKSEAVGYRYQAQASLGHVFHPWPCSLGFEDEPARSPEQGARLCWFMDHLYLEDLQVGQRFTSATHLMEESRIKAFAEEFDPQAFHLDESAGQESVFRGLAASGWHTAAVAMRLLVTGGLPIANGIIGVGGEIAWPRPTRPGDTLRVESEIVEITPSRSKPNQGIVTVRSTTLNQNGESVYVFTSRILVFRRPPITPGTPAA